MYEVALPDGTIIEVPDEMPPQEARKRILKAFPQFADKSRSFGDVAADTGVALLAGTGVLGAFPGQLLQLAPGFYDAGSRLAAPGKALQDKANTLYSEGTQARAAEQQQKIAEADKEGFLSGLGTAVGTTISDPALLTKFVGEQVPLLAGPGAAAKIARIAKAGSVARAGVGLEGLAAENAIKAAKESADRVAYRAAMGTGAAMQSADVGDDAFTEAMAELARQFPEMPEKERQELALSSARRAAGIAAAFSGVSMLLPGAGAIEARLAGLPGRGRISSALGEAGQEMVEEGGGQFGKNYALQAIDPTRSLTEGLGSAVGLGALGGGVLGGVLGNASPESLRAQAERLQAEIGALRALEQTEQTQQALAEKEQQMVGLQSAMTAAVSNEAAQPRRGVSPELGQLMETNREQQGIAGILAGQKSKGLAGTTSPGITSSAESLVEFNQLLVPTISPYATGLESALTAAETSGGVNKASKTPSLAPSQQIMGQGTRMPFPTGVNAAVGVPPKKSLRIEPFTLDALAEIPWEAKSFTEVGKPMLKTTGSAKIVDLAGRKIVLADVNGTQVPFYLSSGAGGKAKVPAGKWYPFFGVGADGWLNKGSQDQIRNYYENQALADMAKQLDANIGDIRDDRSIPAVGATGRHIDTINGGMVPAENGRADTVERLQENVWALLGKVGQGPLQMPATPRGATEVPFSKPAEIDLNKERLAELQKNVALTEKQRRKVVRNSYKLWGVLRNKLDRYSVTDISSDKSYSALLNKDNGRDLSSLVADGEVDAFLPYNMRSTSPDFDEIDSTNYIKDLLSTSKTHLEYEHNIELRKLTESIDEMTGEINSLLNDKEANELIQQTYDEQRRVDQEADATQPQRKDSDTGKSDDTTGKPAEPEVAKELTDRQKLIIQKTQELQKVLQKMLGQMGMRDVALKITADLTDADGEYSSKLIRLAFDAANPLQTMRHEAIHALKALGFFSPKQWETLTKMAQDTWIPRLKTVDINQQPLEEGGTSRYDAYVNLFTSENKTPAQIEEALLEEAIADAFGEFDATSTPPGLLAAIAKRMRNLFAALKATFSGDEDVEQIFRKVEAGRLKSKTQDGDAEAKQSLRGEVPLSTRTIMEANDEFARAELGLKIKPVRGIANKVRDIAIALNAQTKSEREQMNRQALSVENEKAIASAIADEVAYQLTAGKRTTGTGLGWYSTNYPNAVKYLSKRFPELKDNPHARSVFSALVAVTSNGEKVTKNIDNAIKLYSKIRDGKPLIAMGNRRATALENNLKVIEELLAEHGTNFESVLLEEITVREMNAKLRALDKKADGSYLARTRVPAAAVYFGPKLGAFYANLSGSEGYLTMDLWWTRSINRMRGLLISKATDASIIKFRDMMGDPSLDRDAVIAAAVPLRNKYEEYGFNTELEHLVGAKEPAKSAGKPAWEKKAQEVAGAAYDQLKYEHSLEKMSNTIYKNEFEVLEEAPFTATDRAFMYRAGRRAQSMLRSDGIDLTLADIQAALWYYEKRLYEKLSGKKANDIGYEEAILAQADSANRRARPSVVFAKRDDSGDVSEGEVSDAPEVSGEPTQAQSRGLKKSLRAPQTEAFKQWFGDSKIVGKDGKPLVMYHGTARDINVFKPKQANAIFLTGDREFAEGFASMSLDWVAKNYKDMLTPNQLVEARAFAERLGRQTYSRNPKLAEQITKDLRQGKDTEDATDLIATAVKQMLDKTKRVMEVYVRAEKPFDYDNPDHIKQVADLLPATVRAEVAFSDEPGISYTKLDAIEKLKTGEWDIVESKPVQKATRELGFDSFYTQEGGEKNIAVYNSNQIKSATNNEGTYDINNPDIRKSLRATEVPKEDAKKFWQGAEKIERTEGVEAAEEAWIGGIADFGNRAAARDIQRMPGYQDYQDSIINLAKQNLAQGSGQFYVYRYGNLGLKDEVLLNEEYDALDPKATTLSINFAKKFKHFAGFDEDLDPDANMGWMRISIFPEAIVMVGKQSENELVIDPNSLAPDAIEIIGESFEPAKPEGKFSLRSPIGLYSELETKIEGISSKQAPAAQWKTMINALPQKGVKPEEIEWSGVNDWLDAQGGKVSKDDLLNYLKEGGVKVEETVLSDKSDIPKELLYYMNHFGPLPEDIESVSDYLNIAINAERDAQRSQRKNNQEEANYYFTVVEQANEMAERMETESGVAFAATQYAEYTLPGGKNYQEVLLRLPVKQPKPKTYNYKEALEQLVKFQNPVEVVDKYGKFVKNITSDWQLRDNREKIDSGEYTLREYVYPDEKGQYLSSHWKRPNILAHIRMNDRIDADGKKVLFVEEIQSDWGQEGKKKGFVSEGKLPEGWEVVEHNYRAYPGGPITKTGYFVVDNTKTQVGLYGNTREEAIASATQRKGFTGGVPAAPFVGKTEGWLNLALKRIMVMAAEGNYDKVAFVNGEQSAERYDLSKQVDLVSMQKLGDKYSIAAYKNDKEIVSHKVQDEKEAADVVGKEMAAKLFKDIANPRNGGRAEVSGDGLKVGGEGMKTFYDTIVPTTLKKLLPKVDGERLTSVTLSENNNVRKVRDDDGTFAIEERKFEEDRLWDWIAFGLSEQEVNARLKADARMQQLGFDVTPSMKQKVETTGLPKFSLRSSKGVGYHAGNLGYGTDTALGRMTGGRSTGHFGTGTYFTGTKEKLGQRSADRPIHEVSLAGYNLARPRTEDDAKNLHDGLRIVNDLTMTQDLASRSSQEKLRKAAFDIWLALLPKGVTIDMLEEKLIPESIKQVATLAEKLYATSTYAESASTVLMRRLGYEGVDVRHLKAFDNTEYGTVVYGKQFKEKPSDAKFSLRGTPAKAMPIISQAAEDAVTRTTKERDEKSFIQNILDAISPSSFTSFRSEFLNRYNGLSIIDKRRVQKMGGAAAMADVSAESAALLSDVGAGITAAVFGVEDKVGGAPVYARTYYVVKNDQVLPARYKTEAEAKKAAGPTGSVRYGGHTQVSNFNGTIKGPLAIFAPLAAYNNPRVYQHYQFWAAVKRGKRFTAEGREQLLTQNDIKLAKEYEKAYPEFESIQQEWIKYNNQLVQYMVDTGVLSQERAKVYTEHSDYIPFYRQIEGSDKAVGPTVFSAISGVKPPKMAKGSTAVLDDFLETIVRNTQSAIQAGIKNIAAQKAVEAAMDVGIATKLSASSGLPNVVVVHEKGVPTYYNCEDALFVNAVKSLGMSEIPFLNIIAAPANLLREMVTKEPTFLLANMLRDSLSAYVTSGTNMVPVFDTFKNFGKALVGKSPEFVALTKAGILGGYDFAKGVDMGGRKFGEMLLKKADIKPNGLFPNVVGYGKSFWGVLEKGSSASDAATRMEIYKRTLAETGNETEAIFRSLEVMNFNRKGRNALVRLFTAMVPFLNARMQGLDILYRTALEPSVTGQPVSARQRQLQRSFFLRGAMMAGMSCLYWLMVHDDEEYKKQEQETKDNNWLIPGLGVRMPTPFEVGFFFKTVPERIMALTFGDDELKDFRESMIRGAVNTLKVVPIPLAVLPTFENMVNFSTFTGRPIVGPGTSDIAAGYQVNTNTSQVIADLGRELGISPIKIEHAIQGHTGQMGMYMVALIDAMWNANNPVQKPAKQFYQLPMIKRFAVDPEARGKLTQFYQLKNDVDEVVRTSNDMERSGKFDELDEYQKGKMALLDNKEYVLAIEQSLGDIRDQKKEILSSEDSPQDKADALLELQRMENDLVDNIQEIRKEAYGPD